jgi:hypothetical protein
VDKYVLHAIFLDGWVSFTNKSDGEWLVWVNDVERAAWFSFLILRALMERHIGQSLPGCDVRLPPRTIDVFWERRKHFTWSMEISKMP